MNDPLAVLGLPAEADDAAIRRRYLELIKQFTPEQHPQRFAEVRRAYEAVRTAEDRVKYRLFEKGTADTTEAIIEELACLTPRRRVTMKELHRAIQPR